MKKEIYGFKPAMGDKDMSTLKKPGDQLHPFNIYFSGKPETRQIWLWMKQAKNVIREDSSLINISGLEVYVNLKTMTFEKNGKELKSVSL